MKNEEKYARLQLASSLVDQAEGILEGLKVEQNMAGRLSLNLRLLSHDIDDNNEVDFHLVNKIEDELRKTDDWL